MPRRSGGAFSSAGASSRRGSHCACYASTGRSARSHGWADRRCSPTGGCACVQHLKRSTSTLPSRFAPSRPWRACDGGCSCAAASRSCSRRRRAGVHNRCSTRPPRRYWHPARCAHAQHGGARRSRAGRAWRRRGARRQPLGRWRRRRGARRRRCARCATGCGMRRAQHAAQRRQRAARGGSAWGWQRCAHTRRTAQRAQTVRRRWRGGGGDLALMPSGRRRGGGASGGGR